VPHTIRIKRSAAKALEAIDDADTRGRIADAIDALRDAAQRRVRATA